MINTPKDKMIKTAPETKAVDEKKKEVEIIEEESGEQISPESKKEIQVIERVMIQEKSADDVWEKLSEPQIEIMKRTVAKGATDDELKFFLNVCVGAKLNPFLRQVHFVKRWSNKEGKEIGSIQVGIDGFRSIAESGGQYAGSDDAIMKGEGIISVIVDKVTTQVKVPESATVTVHKLMGGQRYPFTATARWSEYYPGPKQGYMWHKMPYGQLAKCAEALALRKAFPKLLSGLYSPEEMDQAKSTPAIAAPAKKFQIAQDWIAKITDLKVADEYKERIFKSVDFDDAQKSMLVGMVDHKIEQITGMPKI